jgi:conjugative transfer signal peptidase TraF
MLGAAGIIAALLSFQPLRPAFIWNFSASAPVGLYRLLDRPWTKGDWVALRTPQDVEAMLSHYREPSGRHLLIKRVAAVEGDVVCRRGAVLSINNHRVAVALHASDGFKLPRWSGCRRLRSGEIFVLGATPRSFDSRYFGLVPERAILSPIAKVGF